MKHTKASSIFKKTELDQKETALLYLIPLVQTAWSHKAIAPDEKQLIFRSAREDGIDSRDSFNDLLDDFLTYQPSNDFFAECLKRICDNFERMTKNEKKNISEKILGRCKAVAASAGSNSPMDLNRHISIEESMCLQRLQEILR